MKTIKKRERSNYLQTIFFKFCRDSISAGKDEILLWLATIVSRLGNWLAFKRRLFNSLFDTSKKTSSGYFLEATDLGILLSL